MIHATGHTVRKWSKEDASIEDLTKIGLKGSPTVVSKVFGPTPRSEKAAMVKLDTTTQSIFTRHPTLEQDLIAAPAHRTLAHPDWPR